MNKIELSKEERDFFDLVAVHLKEKGMTRLENLTQTNIKQAMLEVRERQIRLADQFCNNEEFAQAVVVKMAKTIYTEDDTLHQRTGELVTFNHPKTGKYHHVEPSQPESGIRFLSDPRILAK